MGEGQARRSRRRRRRTTRAASWASLATALVGWAGFGSAAATVPDPAADLQRAEPQNIGVRAAAFGGTIERHPITLHGLPVRGAYETVRRDAAGVEHRLAARLRAVAPQLLPSQARLSVADVPEALAIARSTPNAPPLESPPRLVYLMVLDTPVLAWESQLALSLSPEPTRPTVWLSAATGRLLREVDQVRTSRARVFLENPSATPTPVEVTLLDIDVDGPGQPLSGARVQTLNCLDDPGDAEVPDWRDEDECYPLATVLSDENGDYFVPLPDVVVVEDNVQPEDPYAELSMYVHAERFLEAMKEAGVEQFACERSTMLANFRTFDLDTGDMLPLNNAYYTNQCDAERGPTMVFGQGSEVDFGYDGDVVYHELGHGMVELLSPDGLTARRFRSDASLVDSPGVNEALADYFSIMLTDEPHLADYVGRFWSATSRAFIRDAENTKTCPSNTVGQVHNDGEPLMAALWATRKRLDDGGKRALDHAVIGGLMRMAPDTSLEEAAALIVEEAERGGPQDSLDADELALLRRSVAARGLDDCPRVITAPHEVRQGRTAYLRRDDASIFPFYPGPMQLRYEAPAAGGQLVVRYTLRPRGSTQPVEATLLLKHGDAPIEFRYDVVAVDEPAAPPEPGETPADPVRELIHVQGDWDRELFGTELSEDEYEIRLGGLLPGEVVHMMLVNSGDVEAIASDWRAHASTELPDDDDSPQGGGGSDDLPGVDEVRPDGASAGCACGTSGEGGPGTGAWWAALASFGFVFARRRRPSHISGARCDD